MRWNIVRSIYLKELRETLRDRRTLVFMIALPLMLYPLMIIGMSKFQRSLDKESLQRTVKLTVWGDAPKELIDRLKSRHFELDEKPMPADIAEKLWNSQIAPFEDAPERDDPELEKKHEKMEDASSSNPLIVAARPLVLDRKADVVLVVWPEQKGKEGIREMAMLYDSVRQDSGRARLRLSRALDDYRRTILASREQVHQLDTGFTRGVRLESRDIAPKTRRSGFGLSIGLPFMLLAITASAGFYRAVDTTAGEKERNTMQTLLCAPVRSLEIVGGKFAAIATITLIAAAANIGSLGMTYGNLTSQMGGVSTLNFVQYLLVFATLVPVALLNSALFLAIGVFAKDFRDGQNLATPVMLLTMMPAGITMLPGVEANVYTVMLPCVNVALLIKALLLGEAKPDFIFLTLISSAAYAALALIFAARVFERENLLTGGKENFRGLFGFSDKRREITPSMAFAAFCGSLVVIFYGQLIKVDLRYLVVIIEYGLILLPVLLLVAALRLPFAETLSLRMPNWKSMVSGVLIGVSAWSVATLFLRLLEPPQDLGKALQKVLLLDRVDIPILWVFFIASISPAICEEILFRGLIQGGMRKMGMAASIFISAFLFGIAHGSIYRMMPVMFLGLVIGWLFWNSKSVFPGMIAHCLNNGIGISFAVVPQVRDYVVQNKIAQIPLSWSLAGSVVLAAGLWMAYQGRERTTSDN